jgi:hypothetical protein
MRLWSLHPRHLDTKGLVALWREALLAQAVLRGRTRGYTHHPQLRRFRAHPRPLAAINAYLWAVHREAQARGFAFARDRVRRPGPVPPMPVTTGQVAHERRHLLAKLARRDPARHGALLRSRCALHPLFRTVAGEVEAWEGGGGGPGGR